MILVLIYKSLRNLVNKLLNYQLIQANSIHKSLKFSKLVKNQFKMVKVLIGVLLKHQLFQHLLTKVIMFVSQVKMLSVELSLTDTHMFSIKIKMVTIVQLDKLCTLARMKQETLLLAALIFLNMQYLDLNMVMPKLFLIL